MTGPERPRPPWFRDPIDPPPSISDRDLEAAVHWAIAWVGLEGADVRRLCEEAARSVRDGAATRWQAWSEAEGLALIAAAKLFSDRRRRVEGRRNAAVFPWQRFYCIQLPLWPPCDAARALDGRLIPTVEFPDLPLAGCDRLRCVCSRRAMNQRMIDRENRPR